MWEFIQNYIGKMEANKYDLSLRHRFKDSEIYYIRHDDSHCCGRYIFINLDMDGTRILRHEYGHRIQSKILGILFYPMVFIPSYLHYLYWRRFRDDDWTEYYDFYCEKWANSLTAKRNT